MEKLKKFILTVLLVALPLSVSASMRGLDKYYDLAVDFLGQPGDCFVMATAYLRELYGDSSYKIRMSNYDQVSESDAKAGDVIYYDSCASSSGGYTTHWAIYLGDGAAMHGNWGKKVIISKSHMEACSSPNFYHLRSLSSQTVDFNLISLDD